MLDGLTTEDFTLPSRYRSEADHLDHVPVHVVWEITLACNLKCMHCGSRAGRPRPKELDTAECIDVVNALAELGTREISLIGGEAYLRKDWVEIIAAIKSHGIYCAIQTGGRLLTEQRLQAARAAGLDGIGVSIDGLEELHDKIRGVPGSYRMALDAVRTAKALGLTVSCNTTIGVQTIAQLPALMDVLIENGVTHWQVQLTVAMGNAVDNEEILLQPYMIGEVIPLLSRLSLEGRDRGLLMIVGNNVGYFGPHEHILRGAAKGMTPYWTGCAAGQTVIGIESDGVIKGCPSLATNGYSGGNVRDKSIREIWRNSDEIHFGRMREKDQLWGHCKNCYYADGCKAGCTWTADSLLGKPGNNPYCHYRVTELEKQGIRERIVKVEDAPDLSFAVGRFELVEEPIPGHEGGTPGYSSPQARRPENAKFWANTRERGMAPAEFELCHGCKCHVWPGETDCPHCGADIAEESSRHHAAQARRSELLARLEALLTQAPSFETI